MNSILVSGIITTYKRSPEMVIRAAESILHQTYENMELIVVDDSPADYDERDDVKKAIEKLDGQIQYIRHETNQGACAARNTGLKVAKGTVVGFLDDDDEWMPDKVEKMLPLFSDPQIALVYCGSHVIESWTGRTYPLNIEFVKEKVFEKLLCRNFIGSTSFPLIRKSALVEIGGFDTQLQASQDHDVWIRLSEKYKVDYIQEPLVKYCLHQGDNISSNPLKKIAGYERLNSKYQDYLKSHPKIFSKRLLTLCVEYAAAGDMRKACSVWIQAVIKNPVDFANIIKGLRNMIRARKSR